MSTFDLRRKPAWRKGILGLWLALWPLLAALYLYPIRFTSLRLTILAVLILLWSGALLLFWYKKPLRLLCLASALVLIACITLPGRMDDSQSLRQEYVRALLFYTGTTYVWGGENRRGIDCSGLMRCALIDANLKRGIITLNPALLREGFFLWWNDCSARAMKEGWNDRTRLLFTAPDLNRMEYSGIEAGDIAVTSSGVHVLAYVGNRTWIEADPNAVAGNRVIQVRVPSRNGWFNMPVHVMRWRQLEARYR